MRVSIGCPKRWSRWAGLYCHSTSHVNRAMHSTARLLHKPVERAVMESTVFRHLPAHTEGIAVKSKIVQDTLTRLMELMGLARQQRCHIKCFLSPAGSRQCYDPKRCLSGTDTAGGNDEEAALPRHPTNTENPSLLPAGFPLLRCRVKHCKVLHTSGSFSVFVPKILSLPCRRS